MVTTTFTTVTITDKVATTACEKIVLVADKTTARGRERKDAGLFGGRGGHGGRRGHSSSSDGGLGRSCR